LSASIFRTGHGRRTAAAVLVALALAFLAPACSAAEDPEAAARDEMVRVVEAYEALTGVGQVSIGRPVLQAMREVPRHLFVPDALRGQAYEDRPLPIGNGQTISQPYVVALMTELLAPEAGDVVLEVGTGSAYQAAVLSRLVRHVYTIEIVAPLAEQAAARLAALGYGNVSVRHGDGYLGWPEAGPFDGIIITAGADHIPEPLIAQLKPGGRLVMPVGEIPDQHLVLLEKDGDGTLRERRILPVAFVPLTRQEQE
jgi:protein-L-isoaspartate(D-aspartate) O-methyltransferase